MSILEFLGLGKKKRWAAGPPAETEAVRNIAKVLERLEPGQARYLAAFAYLLSRVARADLHISEDEQRVMRRIVVERGGLTRDQARLVVEMANHQNAIFGGIEDFQVTREFNKIATRKQKLALLDCLFAVTSADRSISVVEDNAVRQVVKELRLDHKDFIDVRSRYRDHLAVLKKRR